MNVHVIGVRHHSPACARLVQATIRRLQPAYVLIEGASDFNDRIDELLLGHRLPIALLSFATSDTERRMVWAPLCDYSPEWLALLTAGEVGATARFIDLPAWHRAFADRLNRYSDADQRYAAGLAMLCSQYGVTDSDTLWDHLIEIPATEDDAEMSRTAAVLREYFDTLRGSAHADEPDRERESYMSRWVNAAQHHAAGRPVVVVTGGFHRPALMASLSETETDWPEPPNPPETHRAGTYLVPYSYRRLDSFAGYQSGMPSPGYYDALWHTGQRQAADSLVDDVVRRLRDRRVPVSTADLVVVQTVSEGLARLRGHAVPGRTDVLDALASALISEDLPVPLPWAARGTIQHGTHPAVLEMLEVLTGEASGQLHSDTPLPPLVADVEHTLNRHGLLPPQSVQLDLTEAGALARSRILNHLRVLDIPGFTRVSGPALGSQQHTVERWELTAPDTQLPCIIEAAAYGATLPAAAMHRLNERMDQADSEPATIGDVLFDAVLCGATDTRTDILGDVVCAAARAVRGSYSMGGVGRLLSSVLALWRHDWIYQTRSHADYLDLFRICCQRIGWLAESSNSPTRSADLSEIGAMAALRDTLRHAGDVAGLDPDAVGHLFKRLAQNAQTPPDLRGAAFGALWSLSDTTPAVDPVAALRQMSRPTVLGDWLTGLFVLAREQLLGDLDADGVLAALDGIVSEQSEADFLIGLPALRQAFEFFPPRERARIADRLLAARGLRATGRDFVRTEVAPETLAAAHELESQVDVALREAGLSV